jgi:hypothetical protein
MCNRNSRETGLNTFNALFRNKLRRAHVVNLNNKMINNRDNCTHCVEGKEPHRSPRRAQIHGD